MAQEPEVIQREMDDTRHALAEKLEQISEKISGTVDTVTDTVSSVTETVANVTEAVEGTVQTVAETVSGTVESVKDTVSAVGEKASETVEAVKEAFDIPEQVRRNPWLWLGGSIVVGFVGGKLLMPARSRTPEASSFARGRGYYAATEEESHGAPPRAGNGKHTTAPTESISSKTTSMLGNLFQRFGPEIDKLKGLALGTLFGVSRDMISKSLPESLKDQVTTLFNDFTEKAGGQPIQGSVLDENQDSEQSKGGDHESDNPDSAKMDRPLGAVERQGKATVGQANRR